MDIKKYILCVLEKGLCLNNSSHCAAHQTEVQMVERFSELIKKNLSDLQKSETFVYFTKITAATWSINKIIPVSIALVPSISLFLASQSPSLLQLTYILHT